MPVSLACGAETENRDRDRDRKQKQRQRQKQKQKQRQRQRQKQKQKQKRGVIFEPAARERKRESRTDKDKHSTDTSAISEPQIGFDANISFFFGSLGEGNYVGRTQSEKEDKGESCFFAMENLAFYPRNPVLPGV